MNSITIITIVVVAILTIVIFGLGWLAYASCLKTYQMEVDQGKHDKQIYQECHSKKKHKGGLAGVIISYAILALLASLFVTGIIYRANGENLTINNKTVLVIKSGSMSGFYDESDADVWDGSLQFDIGDICVFESDFSELVVGEVYGYKYRDIVVTHRLIEYDEVNKVARFKGDYNPSYDPYLISIDKVLYHYTGVKIPGVGAFILYAQSYFGIWSILGIIGVAVSSEIVYRKLAKIGEARDKKMGGAFYAQ